MMEKGRIEWRDGQPLTPSHLPKPESARFLGRKGRARPRVTLPLGKPVGPAIDEGYLEYCRFAEPCDFCGAPPPVQAMHILPLGETKSRNEKPPDNSSLGGCQACHEIQGASWFENVGKLRPIGVELGATIIRKQARYLATEREP